MCNACIEWGGEIWHTYGRHYERTIRLHRAVWEEANGPIPKGYHVHHVNGNKADNRLENLELLSHGEHSAIHVNDNLAPVRHIAVRNAHAKLRENRQKRFNERVLSCVICGSDFRSAAKHPTKFCSPTCVERARSGAFDPEQRLCEYCGETYAATKRVQKYCSKRCNRLATEQRSLGLLERDISCGHCGKIFTSRRVNAKFCRHSCALAFHGNNRFRGKISATN